MKYAEYQVWYHTFNNAYTSAIRTYSHNDSLRFATETADFVVKKLSEVQMPEVPDIKMDGIDLQNLVDTVARNVTGKKR
jgi:hypothetical protein